MTKRERNIRRGIFFIVVIGIVILLCGGGSAPWVFKGEKQYYTQRYCIDTGDTLWSIAEECKPNDIAYRKYINLLYELNDGLTAEIYPGQAIFVPVYEEENYGEVEIE